MLLLYKLIWCWNYCTYKKLEQSSATSWPLSCRHSEHHPYDLQLIHPDTKHRTFVQKFSRSRKLNNLILWNGWSKWWIDYWLDKITRGLSSRLHAIYFDCLLLVQNRWWIGFYRIIPIVYNYLRFSYVIPL